jgi:hypothetical protein
VDWPRHDIRKVASVSRLQCPCLQNEVGLVVPSTPSSGLIYVPSCPRGNSPVSLLSICGQGPVISPARSSQYLAPPCPHFHCLLPPQNRETGHLWPAGLGCAPEGVPCHWPPKRGIPWQAEDKGGSVPRPMVIPCHCVAPRVPSFPPLGDKGDKDQRLTWALSCFPLQKWLH